MIHQILTFTRTIISSVYITVLIIGAIVLSTQAYSADYIIDSAVTTKTTLNGGDTLTITENGSITIPSNDIGVDMDGNNITINNSGSISGDGDGIDTVDESVNNTVINSGSISTTGDGYDAIRVEDNSTVENTGSLSTTGNSSSGIDGDDGDTILNSGTITTAGDDSDAIVADETNTVTNSGIINTTGIDANGINVNENSTVSNTGSISTTGDDAHGIDVGADSTVTNSGSITTAGEDASGVYSSGNGVTISNNNSISTTNNYAEAIQATGTDATITNSGTISTSGEEAAAIEVGGGGTGANVSNSGTISTTGEDAWGIRIMAANATLVNTGTLTTTGNSSEAIYLDQDNADITNSGTISASGIGGEGILAQGDNTIVKNYGRIYSAQDDGVQIDHADNAIITNSGTIIAPQNSAIQIDGSNAVINNSGTISGDSAILGGQYMTVNLLAGSRLLGTIDLDDAGADATGDTVNIYSGSPSAQITFTGADTINLYGAGVVNGTTVTTVDATMENAYSVGLTTLADSVHRTLSKRSTFKPPVKPVKVASLELSPGLLFRKQKPIAWGQVFGGKRDHDAYDDTLAFGHEHYGISGGYEWDFRGKRFGLMGGLAQSRSESDLMSFDNEANHLFFGGYGFFSFRSINVSTSVIAGYSDYDNKRFVYDNLNGLETAESDTDSLFISPSVTLGTAYRFKEDYELRPSLYAAYHMSYIDGYSESGTTQSNLEIDDRTVRALSSRLQLAVAKILDKGQEIEFRLGASTRFIDNDETEASLAGTTFRYSSAGDDSVYGCFAGVNFRIATNKALTLVADIEAGGAGDNESFIDANIKLEYRF
ncbi:MAG: autotransporter domain-containing protein [Gammaproteobacteria bacterium]|nr:autotransporter domain-containing protein [Gammaproteobacteria bacterium]